MGLSKSSDIKNLLNVLEIGDTYSQFKALSLLNYSTLNEDQKNFVETCLENIVESTVEELRFVTAPQKLEIRGMEMNFCKFLEKLPNDAKLCVSFDELKSSFARALRFLNNDRYISLEYEEEQKKRNAIMTSPIRSMPTYPLKRKLNPLIKKEEVQEPLNPENIMFEFPSSSWLKKICTLLNVEFSRDAYVFWEEIKIYEIKPTSVPDKCLFATTEFGCIAKLFTGKSDDIIQTKIKERIKKLFFKNYKKLRNYEGIANATNEYINNLVFSEKMTPYHFEVMARLMKSRIGIYDGNEFKMFGNSNKKDTITMLLKKDKDQYRIILSLK